MGTISKRVGVVADGRLYADVSLSYSEASKDIASNSSVINWTVHASQIPCNSFGFTGTNRNSACTIKAYINGICVISRALGLIRMTNSNSWSQSGSIRVTHNTDGNKSISISLQIDRGGGNYGGDPWTYGSTSGSASLKLSFIARASSISCPSLTLGSNATIKITRASSSFTERIRYSFGKASEEITPGTDKGSVSWTPPLSLASQIPKATSGTGALYCDTYYEGKCIGTKSIQVRFNLPSSVKPSLSSISAVPVNPSAISSWGIFVQTKSKAKLTVNGAQGAYGSTITGYTIKGGGFQGNSSSFETGLLNKSGEISFEAIVTDSRGRKSDPKTVKISVVPYAQPVLSKYSAVRCLANGTPADEGTCVLGNITFSYSSCSGKNTVTTSVRYRRSGTTSWTDTKTSFSSGKAFVFGNAAISAETSYDIELSIKDAFGTVTIYEMVSTAEVLMDFKAGGKGIAIGKVSEKENAFELNQNWNAYFHGKEIQDLIKALIASEYKTVANRIYPVGSIYISISPTNPGSLFGGTWVQISQGRFLLGESTSYPAKSTGGESSHKLSGDEMPSHNHHLSNDSTAHSWAWGGSGKTVNTQVDAAGGNGSGNKVNTKQGEWNSTAYSGGGKAHNNMPPYFVAYMWERTK
ncbi:DUF859 family phage minor structural protein [Ileibacterium valens]|uniref:DUF859 family phage minor structural protein n=1 Tax=Ileibacterium valens TaxID=1862668 RepID=UPI00272A595C|nr:DUF859 family phage minor structural protein [Ileibacterium valens]